ncbi:hypothetical protein CLV91_1494 [Maribacter vaceletii]|uniref:Uncharacterized protein n=1 Tax=Maribacter vaceletii TaxID=1206816 RepID=A0A495EEU1_9FLAO|nr:hypothetical protein [Maribacter vaceletii]RKR15408.1 hypothetical protein CLV91_1494 [Maribacter vaceletii]
MKTLNYFKTLALIAVTFFFANCTNPDRDNDVYDESVTIDLSAEKITFSINKTTQWEGTATITGTIKNIGDHFSSGRGQQIAYLYERSLGTPTTQLGNIVASKSFSELASNGTLEVSFTRPWNSSSPAEGEFAPEYILVLSYDPDLFIDGNKSNDDTNHDNNEILESGIEINNLFRN